MSATLDAATRAEKLRPPRALAAVGGSLMAPPAPGSRTAWLAWWTGDRGELADVVASARSSGAARLVAGGPPGNYVESGVEADDAARVGALLAAGFAPRGEHVDLRVRTDAALRTVPGVTVARCADDLGEAIAIAFGVPWAWEAERARSHGGLFAARSADGALLGFAAHSGNLAHRGTFGPLGVLPAARGRGVGASLAAAVLVDLGARGFAEVTVPWVAVGTAPFYAGLVTVTARARRLTLSLDLATGTGSP